MAYQGPRWGRNHWCRICRDHRSHLTWSTLLGGWYCDKHIGQRADEASRQLVAETERMLQCQS